MSRQIFRLFATAPSLTEQERREVADEVARLRTLLTHVPGKARVRITANPTGPLGEYVALLMDAHARGVPLPVAFPPLVRQGYRQRRWFATSLEVLDAFTGQLRRDRP